MLTELQMADWDRDGYLVLPGAVDPAACDELRGHVVAQMAAADPSIDGGLTVFDTTGQGHAQAEHFLTSGDKVRWFLEEGAVVDGELTRPIGLAVNVAGSSAGFGNSLAAKFGHAMHDLDPVYNRYSRTPMLPSSPGTSAWSTPSSSSRCTSSSSRRSAVR